MATDVSGNIVKTGDSITTRFPPAARTNSVNASGFMSRPIFVLCQLKYVSFAASMDSCIAFILFMSLLAMYYVAFELYFFTSGADT